MVDLLELIEKCERLEKLLSMYWPNKVHSNHHSGDVLNSRTVLRPRMQPLQQHENKSGAEMAQRQQPQRQQKRRKTQEQRTLKCQYCGVTYQRLHALRKHEETCRNSNLKRDSQNAENLPAQKRAKT